MFNIPCVILAGGKSSRMKEDKCFLPFKNTSLVQYQYNKLKQIFSKVYISSKNNKFNFSCDLILEDGKIFSPLVALHKIFQTIESNNVFIITVDTPNVSYKSIETIINKSKDYSISIAITPDEKTHNLCGVFNKNILSEIKYMLKEDNHKISLLIDNVNSQNIFINSSEEFINLNTKNDYNNILQKI